MQRSKLASIRNFLAKKYPYSKRTRLSGAFTLVEVLIVMSIISFFSSVVLSPVNSARAKARDSQRITQVDQVSKALELYYSKYGTYPNHVPATDVSIPYYWQFMMMDLETENLIEATFVLDTFKLTSGIDSFFNINKAYATIGGPVYYPCSVQDPAYLVAGDYLKSFGYVALNNGANYIIRAKLEDPTHKVLTNSLAGTFIDASVTGPTACDKTLGYYCLFK